MNQGFLAIRSAVSTLLLVLDDAPADFEVAEDLQGIDASGGGLTGRVNQSGSDSASSKRKELIGCRASSMVFLIEARKK